jgi:hypothetical protein
MPCTTCNGLGYRLRELERGGGGSDEDKFSKLQTDPGFQDLVTFVIAPWKVMRLEVAVLANSVDDLSRASFKRVGVFYIEAGQVKHQGSLWHATDTTKSHVTMDIDYVLNSDSITIRTKNAGVVATQWIGYAKKLLI